MNDAALSADAHALLQPWPGPYGGLPPFDRATPAAIDEAMRAAIVMKRAELQAIAANTAPPTFANTIEALEDSGRALARVLPLFSTFANSRSTGEMPAVAQRLAPLLAALDDEVAHDDRLFARIDAVWRERATLGAEQRRLVEVLHTRVLRRGASLAPAARARLAEIHAQLAALSARYNQNLIAESGEQAVFVDDEAALDGVPEALRRAAAANAAEKGQPGRWALTNVRGVVWPVLTHATRRDVRERVWRMWTERGDHAGPNDNKPLVAQMLALRGEKAKLLGHASYAHFALADRMLREPQAALDLLEGTWARVKAAAHRQIADYQTIADAEADRDGRPRSALQPWDRQYFAEKLRRARFGVDGDVVKAHLPLDAMLDAMFWAAGRVHGLAFRRIDGVPLIDPGVRVYEASRGGEPFGIIYFDLLNRPGKMHGSYQAVYRDAETFRGKVLPVVSVNSSLPPSPAGEPILLSWEYANVFFHEFGHALHMLHNTSAYPSLASQCVAWDFVELPALINERWLQDDELLQRFARHHRSGEPIAPALVERLRSALVYDRIFSLNPDFLLPAIVDMRLHLMADGSGRPIDAVRVEEDTVRELGMPEAWDLVMRVTHNFHVFVGAYAAGLYSYLWSDVMAADAAAVFTRSPGGLYDAPTARAWIDTVLGVGHRVPADRAFRDFAGRDPDATALRERFGLADAADATDAVTSPSPS